MKKLILVRHGLYSSWGENAWGLTEQGKAQIERMGRALKGLLAGATVGLLSSTAKRASQSAALLGSHLNTTPEEHGVLGSDGDYGVDMEQTLALIQGQNGADVLVVVTHLEYVEKFPQHFAEKGLGINPRLFPYREIPKGTAWVIDCEQKTCTYLEPLISG